MPLEFIRREDIPIPDAVKPAILDAKKLVETGCYIVDTETTGLKGDAEICEIAVVSHNGEVILDTLVRPVRSIPRDATKIHGIRNKDVANAPTLPEILENEGKLILSDDTGLAIYNADFDLTLLDQSVCARNRHDLLPKLGKARDRSADVMDIYARFYANWSDYYNSYKWYKLSEVAQMCGLRWEGAPHRALADAKMTAAVLMYLAEQDADNPKYGPR